MAATTTMDTIRTTAAEDAETLIRTGGPMAPEAQADLADLEVLVDPAGPEDPVEAEDSVAVAEALAPHRLMTELSSRQKICRR